MDTLKYAVHQNIASTQEINQKPASVYEIIQYIALIVPLYKTYLAKNGVLSFQFRSRRKSKEELASIVMRATIRHCYQPTSNKAQTGMKLILYGKMPKKEKCEPITDI